MFEKKDHGVALSVLDFFRPAPYIEEISDPEEVKKRYKYWRLRTFYGMYVGYALYYFTRKSFTFAIPSMQADLGLNLAEIGMIGGILSLAYGASKFFSGILGDKTNPRYLMAFGLMITGILNLLFGMSSAWLALAIFWGLNGWFQGWGWPGCAKLLTHWYSSTERGRWWSIWNTSHNIGGALIPLIVGGMADYMGWRFAMYVPGVVCIVGGLFLINRLRDTPQSLGLPSIERFRGEIDAQKEDKRSELSTKEILWDYVLRNKYVWILGFASFFVYVIRTALNDWSTLYFVQVKGYSNFVAASCVFWFEIGGFIGSLAAGWCSDILFKGRRNPINVLFTLGTLLVLVPFQFSTVQSPLVDGMFLFFSGFFIFGPQMLIGMAAAEVVHKKAAATASGLTGWISYIGAFAAGGPLGKVIMEGGWDGFFTAMTVSAVIATILLVPLWSVKSAPVPAS